MPSHQVTPNPSGKAAQLQAELGMIGRSTGTLEKMPLPFGYGSGLPPMDAGAWDEAEVFAQTMRAAAQRYAGVAVRQNAYHELLGRYVVAIREAGVSLSALAAILTAPVDLNNAAAQLFKVAFDLRDGVAAFRHPAPTTAKP